MVMVYFLNIPLASGQKDNYTSEVGLFLGGSYYIGDLNQGNHFNNTKLAGGVIYRHNYNLRFTLQGNLFYGSIAADDSKSHNFGNQQRNLSFKSPIIEAGGQFEFNFMPYKIGDEKYPFSPYLFLGIGIFKFNPQAELNGEWYDLQPLSTEGQGTIANASKPYALIQASVPFGAGIKFNIGKVVGLSLEWGMRKTFTDYLDDVSKTYAPNNLLLSTKGTIAATLADRSLIQNKNNVNSGRQRGFSGTNDWYSFSGIILSFKIAGAKEKCYNMK